MALGRAADGLRPLRSRHEADPLALPCQSVARGRRLPPLPRGRNCPDRDRDDCVRTRAGGHSRRRAAAVRRDRLRCNPCLLLRLRRSDLPRRDNRGGRPRLANELAEGLAEVTHPESGEPAFDVRRKEELYRGFYLDRAPELVLVPRDERVHVDSTRQRWSETFQRHERLFARGTAHFSGQHAVTGILAAAGPGIGRATVPPASEITQIPATLLALHGLAAELDASAIETILDAEATEPRRQVDVVSQTPVEPSGYTPEEEDLIVRRLQDLGYE